MLYVFFGLLALVLVLGYGVLVIALHLIKLEQWAFKQHLETHEALNKLLKLK